MEVAIFLGCILVILLILGSMPAINEHCELEYDYKPFSVGNFYAVFLVYAFLFGTVALLNETTGELTANSTVLLVLAVLTLISMFVNIASKTSLAVAIYTTLLILTLWPLIITIMVIVIAVYKSNKEG